MKLKTTVAEIKNSGSRLTLRLDASPLPDDQGGFFHEVEVPNTATARRAFVVGRAVEITITPK